MPVAHVAPNDLSGGPCLHPLNRRRQRASSCRRESAARVLACGRSRSIGPSGSHSVSGSPSTSTSRRRSSSARAGSSSIWSKGRNRRSRKASNAALAAATCSPVRVCTSSVGMLGMPVTVVLPRPDCVLFATHQCKRSPNVELHHSANAYSCSGFSKMTDGQAIPPMHGRSVMATISDCELNLRSRL